MVVNLQSHRVIVFDSEDDYCTCCRNVNVSNKKNNGVLNWTILERKIRIWTEDNTDNIIASLKMMVRRIKGFLIFDKNV